MGRWDNEELTVRQKWYIEDLGGIVPEGCTKKEAHEIIYELSHKPKEYKPKREIYVPPGFNPFGGMD